MSGTPALRNGNRMSGSTGPPTTELKMAIGLSLFAAAFSMIAEKRVPLFSSFGLGSLASRLMVTKSILASSTKPWSSLGKILSSSNMAPVPSSGLFMLPKSATAACNCDLVASVSSGTSMPAFDAASETSVHSPPEPLSTPMPRPPRYFLTKPSQEKTLTLSISSLMLRTETMPPWRNTASTTSAAPARDPE